MWSPMSDRPETSRLKLVGLSDLVTRSLLLLQPDTYCGYYFVPQLSCSNFLPSGFHSRGSLLDKLTMADCAALTEVYRGEDPIVE